MLSELNDPREDLEFALAVPASIVFVAVDEAGRIAGTIMAGHDGHRGNLYYIAVDPSFRRRGIGSRLVAAAESWLQEAGIRKIHLLVLSDNLAVKPFYDKLGYGEAPAILLRKWLARPPRA
jgi:ribosomal protein S18 acetylase RimI-like enzyme